MEVDAYKFNPRRVFYGYPFNFHLISLVKILYKLQSVIMACKLIDSEDE